MTRTEFLREQTLSGANKCRRAPLPDISVAELSYSLAERKALALKYIFDNMPIYIGEKELIKALLSGYFKLGGMQHQPNVADGEVLKRAQATPEKYKDLIVRLWGVSAHFVDLPKELQDEMISRFG